MGVMLGSSCSPCCSPDPCGCQSGESLPNYVAVTFRDLPDKFIGEISTGGTRSFDCQGVFSAINDLTVSLPYIGVCRYAGCIAGRWVTVIYRGRQTPPIVELGGVFTDGGAGPGAYFYDCPLITFTADPADAPFECSAMAFTASNRSAVARLFSEGSVGVTVPAGSVTVAPATELQGRCWSALSESVPSTVTVEISGAKDIESRLKLSPITNTYGVNLPGVAVKMIDKLEFLNGVYTMNYSGSGGRYGGCVVHVWEHCFQPELEPCGGTLRLFLPKYAGGAWLEFWNSNAPRVLLAVKNTGATPEYLDDVYECPPFYETSFTPPPPSLSNPPPPSEVWSKRVSLQPYGFSFNIWPANGFCVGGAAQLEFERPTALLGNHSAGDIALFAGRDLALFPNQVLLPFYEAEGAVVEWNTTPDALVVSASFTINPNPEIKLTLRISSCFGIGAAGVAQAQELGPVTGVSLTRPGSGYAKLGRRQPTLSIAGLAATFSLSQQAGACNLPYWKIDSISAPSGIGGFTDGQAVTVSASTGDTVELAAQCTVETERAEPSLTASASTGAGAVFSVETADNENGTWRVTGVTFTGTPSGYEDGGYLSFGGTSVTEDYAALVRIITGRDEPEMALAVYSWVGGSGAVLTPTVSTNGGNPETWGISAVAIDNGGSGYSAGDQVYATGSTVEWFNEFFGEVSSVDESGAITGITIYYGGMYYGSNGVIESLSVEEGGSYYLEQVASVVVANGGKYYREDASLPPIVADVVVSVVQPAGSSGAGAVIEASVNEDTASPQFGQLNGLTLIAGGGGYTTRRYTGNCGSNPFP